MLSVNGQDGSYAAECFLKNGYTVLGIGRQNNSKWMPESVRVRYYKLDLRKFSALKDILEDTKPSIIFNAVAVHGPASFSYESVWEELHAVNIYLTQGILEYLRNSNSNSECSYSFLSSSKVFDLTSTLPVNEESILQSNCLYSISKTLLQN